MDNFHMIKLKDKKCPICGNTKYMYHMSGRNVGSINVKCTNCNSYFRWDEISEQPELANNSTKLDKENGELISRQHFDSRVRSAVGMVEEDLTDDFKDGINAVLDLLKTEPSIEPTVAKKEIVERVKKNVYEQCKWERDTALQQLKDLGYGLGEKPRVDGDAISRKQAISLIKEYERDSTCPLDYVSIIKQVPSIEPRKGRWIYSDGTPAELWGSYGVYCSACKEQSEEASNFCGNCGADMREGES